MKLNYKTRDPLHWMSYTHNTHSKKDISYYAGNITLYVIIPCRNNHVFVQGNTCFILDVRKYSDIDINLL